MTVFKKMTVRRLATLWLLVLMGFSVHAEDALDIATTPLSNSGTSKIKPNMIYVLDDSGSMGRSYMPDWATKSAYRDDASYNAVAYDPAVRYDPPAFYTTTGGLDATTYPSQAGMDTATGADRKSKPNWHKVNSDAYLGGSNTNLEGLNSGTGPQYTVSVPHEYCKNVDLKECVKLDLPTETYPHPAPLRWCKTQSVAQAEALPADGECQGVRVGSYDEERFPIKPDSTVTTYQATITLNSLRFKPGVSGVTVNGQQIVSGNTGTSWNRNTLAKRTKERINDCTSGQDGNCTVVGYAASSSGSVVTIVSTNAADLGKTPVLSYSGTVNYSATPFVKAGTTVVKGQLDRVTVTITPSNGTYIYPGKGVRHTNRTDCDAKTHCTYDEEMTNYANWYTYYRTRMQLMKTATSLAFKEVGDDFRMGFMTINENASLNVEDFSGSHKATWYRTLFAAKSDGGTPLPRALSNAGLVYANNFSGIDDPVQYACQANFTLLTTDGVYNGPFKDRNGYEVDGSTYIGNEDSTSSVKPPKYDALGQTGTLADVAKYYRDIDLRTSDLKNCSGALSGEDVCQTSATSNTDQNMVTYTLGLGVDGQLAYSTTYADDIAGDFADIKNGFEDWPDADLSDTSYNSYSDDVAAARTDDVWHAAVNGDGKYFSAKKTASLIEQLREAISLIKLKTGAGAAAATSTLNPVSGDNFAYVASYTTEQWTGNLEKREIDLTSGKVKAAAKTCVEDVVPDENCASPKFIESDGLGNHSCVEKDVTDDTKCAGDWVEASSECRVEIKESCNGELRGQVTAGTRKIKINDGSNKLVDFTFSNLSATQQANFASTFLQNHLTQWGAFNQDQIDNYDGEKLVDYIKGNKTYEQSATIDKNKLFRKRATVLGDLIDSKPSFIGAPTFSYGDAGYQAFKASNASRDEAVYVGSNDGMLHAFDADTLVEKWAFVPSAVVPNLWKLADSNYSNKHSYYVNGDVTISDVCIADCAAATASDWKTILVGGLDGGGRSYYALDITDPKNPTLLWEIDPSDNTFKNLGYTYGNPIVTKRATNNGASSEWVVLFTSGYNNIPDDDTFYKNSTDFKPNLTPQFTTGDGGGYLYVVDAYTGTHKETLSTGKGSTSSPSGLAKISAYAEFSETNNIATYVYGGDLDGNVWRFNIDENATDKVLQFATLKDAADAAQPIMTPPELAEVNNKRMVFVGTGKYLEVADLLSVSTQSLYGLLDTANDGDPAPVYANPRAYADVVSQTIKVDSADNKKRVTDTSNKVDLDKQSGGWYIDFPDSGERQNVASQLVLGTLLVPTTVPDVNNNNSCQAAGYGWFNYFDYKTGTAVVQSTATVSQKTTAPPVGFNVIFIKGKPKVSNVQADNPNPELLDDIDFNASSSGFQIKRSIWREIIDFD